MSNDPAFFIIDSKEKRLIATSFVSHIKGHPVMQVEVKPYKAHRSQAQNRLMWMWYGVIAKDLGMTPEELHEVMKARVLGFVEVDIPRALKGDKPMASRIAIPRSTTSLNSGEMTNYLEAIDALARELGIILPHPDDYRFAMYGERVC